MEATMHISGEGLLIMLLVGLVAGWLAGQLVAGGGFGLIPDIAIGIVGALIGTWFLPLLGIHIGSGVVSSIIVATIGAVILLLIVGLVRRGFPTPILALAPLRRSEVEPRVCLKGGVLPFFRLIRL
jgi:uncharacterized membrane protein YeaQ/YmgE (transglycosylase-associated protein family)